MDPVAKARLMAIVNEELSWGDVGLAITLGLCGFHGPWVQQTGDAELIERFCGRSKPTIGCWALTEPDHGSDTVAFSEPHFSDPALKANCIARKDGDEYVISGQKAAWVSNGTIADIAVLFCTIDLSQGFKGGGGLPGAARPARRLARQSRWTRSASARSTRARSSSTTCAFPPSYMVVGPELYAHRRSR